MAIRSDEIISIIKSAIDTFDEATETRNVGTVVEVGDGIAQIYGLAGALASELLEFPGGVMGMALNLEEETVGAVVLGDSKSIKEGDTVKTTGRVVEVPVGASLLGRVVDPLGRPVDDKGPIRTDRTRVVERIAPGVIVRQGVDTPVQTGIKGTAWTFAPIHLYDLRLKAGHRTELTLPAGSNTGVFLLNGTLLLNGSHSVKGAVLALFDTQGKRVSIEAKEDATIL
ncbi:MAG: hypothetical protein L0221_15995, partial [Chloroflexi bacterium]|nr:hypothetical protein [Chloroflexota bacterium]